MIYYINSLTTQLAYDLDELIKKRFIDSGIDVNNIQDIKDNCARIICYNDPFEHWYYKQGTPEEKRIISIEREFTITGPFENDNQLKVRAERMYY